jgi:hypothetical protein
MVPGGWAFTDARTGKKFDGMSVSFDEQVGKIIQHRLLNPRVYPATELKFLTFEDVQAELDKFQCDRLGNAKRFCTGPQATANYFKLAGKFCPECGGTMMERFCPTCGGRRKVVGWTCQRCKKEFQK